MEKKSKPTYLPSSQIEWIGVRLLDDSARTFKYENIFYKAIFQKNIDFIKSLFKNKTFEKLISEGYIPNTEISNFKTEEFQLILKQETESFNITPEFWNPLMLKDAALTYLRFMRYLNSHNLTLKDGHTWNIVFQKNSKPKWCDIGSIIPANGKTEKFNEFIEFFAYPLLIRKKSEHLARLSRYYSKNKCTHNEAQEILGHKIIIKDKSRPLDIIDSLEKFIDNINFNWDKTLWSDYHDSMTNENWDLNSDISTTNITRINIVKRLLKTIMPKSIVDLGANAGMFTILSAQTGAEVLAIEPDESACAKCYINIKGKNNIKAKIATASVGYKTDTIPDLAIALALTHHMFFTGKFRLEIIAKLLSCQTSKYLITKFMPNGLGGNTPKPNPLPSDYNIDIFISELKKYFYNVEVFNQINKNPQSAHRIQIFAFNKK